MQILQPYSRAAESAFLGWGLEICVSSGFPSNFYAHWSLRRSELDPLLCHLPKDIPLVAVPFLFCIIITFFLCHWINFHYHTNKLETEQKIFLDPKSHFSYHAISLLSFFSYYHSISFSLPALPKIDLAKAIMAEITQMVTKLFPLLDTQLNDVSQFLCIQMRPYD